MYARNKFNLISVTDVKVQGKHVVISSVNVANNSVNSLETISPFYILLAETSAAASVPDYGL